MGIYFCATAKPDGTVYTSKTRPTHERGSATLDGIHWGLVQEDVTYTAGVRNVVFRDIFLHKPRTGFSVHFDNGRYSRSYYPGAPLVQQEQLLFDNLRVTHKRNTDLFAIGTPVDCLTIVNSSLFHNKIRFHGNRAMEDYLKTQINLIGCVFKHEGEMTLVTNSVNKKQITLNTAACTVLNDEFRATVEPGPGKIAVSSDLPGLK